MSTVYTTRFERVCIVNADEAIHSECPHTRCPRNNVFYQSFDKFCG